MFTVTSETRLINRNLALAFISSVIILGCEKVSDEALNAGFKTDQEYQLHLTKLKRERDQALKERILYATNLNSLEADSEYNLAIELLSKEQRKYISQGGNSVSLLVASNAILDLKNEFDSVKISQNKSRDEGIACLKEIDTEPNDNKIAKAAYDLQVLICQWKMLESDSLSKEFVRIHSAARLLVNSDKEFLTKEDALLFLNNAYLDQ